MIITAPAQPPSARPPVMLHMPYHSVAKRITSRCNSPTSALEHEVENAHPVLVERISANKVSAKTWSLQPSTISIASPQVVFDAQVQIEETSFAVVSYAGHSKKGYGKNIAETVEIILCN